MLQDNRPNEAVTSPASGSTINIARCATLRHLGELASQKFPIMLGTKEEGAAMRRRPLLLAPTTRLIT
jgi:hypothetical protein